MVKNVLNSNCSFGSPHRPIIWQPEYAEYMIEGLPGSPFGQFLNAFTSIQRSMSKRREQLESHLPEGCCALTISMFPRYVQRSLSHT